ncbi:MAG TPA: hypothetical protein PK156_49615 [Polyangium sp.]|nr:hypothetical protein [Polyangium sp.]
MKTKLKVAGVVAMFVGVGAYMVLRGGGEGLVTEAAAQVSDPCAVHVADWRQQKRAGNQNGMIAATMNAALCYAGQGRHIDAVDWYDALPIPAKQIVEANPLFSLSRAMVGDFIVIQQPVGNPLKYSSEIIIDGGRVINPFQCDTTRKCVNVRQVNGPLSPIPPILTKVNMPKTGQHCVALLYDHDNNPKALVQQCNLSAPGAKPLPIKLDPLTNPGTLIIDSPNAQDIVIVDGVPIRLVQQTLLVASSEPHTVTLAGSTGLPWVGFVPANTTRTVQFP